MCQQCNKKSQYMYMLYIIIMYGNVSFITTLTTREEKTPKTSNTCKDLKSSCIISNSFKNPEYAT